MTREQLKDVKVGDVLLCVISDWHFSKGDVYKVLNGAGFPTIWCDNIEPHWVHTLDPTMFEVMGR
jgi:hypothetical protein